jgi:hypothetical protein
MLRYDKRSCWITLAKGKKTLGYDKKSGWVTLAKIKISWKTLIKI